jgi:L-seryl-tRNA(Ser) seleniumtransferase
MPTANASQRPVLPSVDRILRLPAVESLGEKHGRALLTDVTRQVLSAMRAAGAVPPDEDIVRAIASRLERETRPSLLPVFNLTGTVLHTNLGRAALPEEAVEAVAAVSRGASNLEFDLDKGSRGDRDSHIDALLCRLTGAEAATVVNNNAAAVLLVLNTLALRKEVPVSRGELIEIGGAFRMPDIMARAGCKLYEVGTTNRTHLKDFEGAIGPHTAMLMSVHTSNYEVQGFTARVPEQALADLAHRHGLPYVVDLGSGTLVDLGAYGLPHEETPAEAIAAGADLVSFSGDKLLGGPQAGIIVGRRELIAKLRRNPLKRALRLDKMTIAALSAVLALYLDKDRLARRLPTLRMLSRPLAEIEAAARRVLPEVAARLGDAVTVVSEECRSQIGSGALPVDLLPSVALRIEPRIEGRGRGKALNRLAAAFRSLPIPVIGRIQNDAFLLDLRCLEDESAFLGQLRRLDLG